MAKLFKSEITNKEKILGDVRNAVIEKQEALFQDIDQRTDTWVPIEEEIGTAVTFVQNFKNEGGIFVYLDTENDFAECLKQLAPENGWEPLWCTSPIIQLLLKQYDIPFTETPNPDLMQKRASITDCECLVAQTGSIVLSEAMTHSREIYAATDVLLVVAHTHQIVDNMKDVFIKLKGKYDDDNPSQLVVITGPSRTTDIEQILITGVHGARQVAVFLLGS